MLDTKPRPADGTLMAETLRNGISVERVRREDSVVLPSNHYHDYYEIYYLLAGERRFFIKDTTYDLQKGALVLIKPKVIHRTVNLGRPAHERILVNFRRRVLEDAFGDESLLAPFQGRAPVFRLDPPNQYALEQRFDRLYAEFRGVDPLSRGLCPILLCELVAAIARINERVLSHDLAGAEAVHARYHDIARYLSENYAEKIGLRQLADKFNLSPFHLCRRFKETTGFSIVEYLNNVRIIEAQHLLQASDMRVAELAGLVGFDSISHFGRTFKRLIGVSPLRYKKMIASSLGRVAQS
jgi:AraC-like DNA-binding protein